MTSTGYFSTIDPTGLHLASFAWGCFANCDSRTDSFNRRGPSQSVWALPESGCWGERAAEFTASVDSIKIQTALEAAVDYLPCLAPTFVVGGALVVVVGLPSG